MDDHTNGTTLSSRGAPTAAPSLLEEFATTVSHELATPLAVIQTATETALHLGDAVGPDEHRRLLEVIRRNSNLAVLLLRRLGLARDVEAGTVILDLGAIDLAQVVTETVDDLRSVVLEGHEVEVAVTEEPVIEADETAVREILLNLLSNAAKYSPTHAPILVTVGAAGSTASVVVRNHGCGVAPEDNERIFEKYLQLDENSPGAGLGLFISRGLARAHGGDLSLRPAEREGSEFELHLPLPVL
jgi:signal transduction histidine kinase